MSAADLGEAARSFGITAEEMAEAAHAAAPYMPEIPVPSRWSAVKLWFDNYL